MDSKNYEKDPAYDVTEKVYEVNGEHDIQFVNSVSFLLLILGLSIYWLCSTNAHDADAAADLVAGFSGELDPEEAKRVLRKSE